MKSRLERMHEQIPGGVAGRDDLGVAVAVQVEHGHRAGNVAA